MPLQRIPEPCYDKLMLRFVDTHEPMTGLSKLRSRWSFLYARELSIEVLKVTKEKEIRFWKSMLKKSEVLEVADARRVQWAGPFLNGMIVRFDTEADVPAHVLISGKHSAVANHVSLSDAAIMSKDKWKIGRHAGIQ